jgi:hypothetical protein
MDIFETGLVANGTDWRTIAPDNRPNTHFTNDTGSLNNYMVNFAFGVSCYYRINPNSFFAENLVQYFKTESRDNLVCIYWIRFSSDKTSFTIEGSNKPIHADEEPTEFIPDKFIMTNGQMFSFIFTTKTNELIDDIRAGLIGDCAWII